MKNETMAYANALELEQRGEDLGGVLVGYAARFFDPANPETTQIRIGPKAVERLMPGALDNITRDVVALAQHDQARPLGRQSAGTLRLQVDQVGLRFEVDLPNNTDGQDVGESVRRGDINGASFGFLVPPGGALRQRGAGGVMVRALFNVDLVEVSPVTLPANAGGTSVVMRAELPELAAELEELRRDRVERRLRELRLDAARFGGLG